MVKRAMTDTNKNKNKKQKCNKIDPILLNPLGKHVFTYTRDNGLIIKYNIKTLVQYMLSSGNFMEPETRIDFSDEDLIRLDKEAKQAGFKLQSTYDAKQNTQLYREKKEKENMLLTLESLLDDEISDILNIIESYVDINNYFDPHDRIDLDHAIFNLKVIILPKFTTYFIKMKTLDRSYANNCVKNYIEFLKGPKNKPTIGNDLLLYFVIDELSTLLRT